MAWKNPARTGGAVGRHHHAHRHCGPDAASGASVLLRHLPSGHPAGHHPAFSPQRAFNLPAKQKISPSCGTARLCRRSGTGLFRAGRNPRSLQRIRTYCRDPVPAAGNPCQQRSFTGGTGAGRRGHSPRSSDSERRGRAAGRCRHLSCHCLSCLEGRAYLVQYPVPGRRAAGLSESGRPVPSASAVRSLHGLRALRRALQGRLHRHENRTY